MKDRKSQKQMIREYLAAGNTITQMEALTKFGCSRLSGRIKEIREDFWEEYCNNGSEGILGMVLTEMIPVAGFGGRVKRVAQYEMIEL